MYTGEGSLSFSPASPYPGYMHSTGLALQRAALCDMWHETACDTAADCSTRHTAASQHSDGPAAPVFS
jgi:hypothetical protein